MVQVLEDGYAALGLSLQSAQLLFLTLEKCGQVFFGQGEQFFDLPQAEPKLFQRDNAVAVGQFYSAVITISRHLVNAVRRKKPFAVIEPEGLYGYSAQL